MEKMFDFGIDLILPLFSSQIVEAIDSLQKEQDPPYSKGVFFIEIRKRVISGSGFIYNTISPIVIDPLFSALYRINAFYSNKDCTRFSMTKINDEY